MTFLQHIQQECGGEYPLRQILDNLEDNQIIDSINNYVKTLKNMESSSRIIDSCEHNNTYQENVKCTLCDDCGDIVETDI